MAKLENLKGTGNPDGLRQRIPPSRRIPMTRFSRCPPFFLTIAKIPCKIKHTLPAAGCQPWRIIPLYIFFGFCYTVPRPKNADRRVFWRFFIIEAIILATRTKRETKQALSFWSILIRTLPVFAGMLCFCSARWFVSTYGRIGFDSVLFTLTAGLSGVQSGLITAYLTDALLPAVLLTGVLQYPLPFLGNGYADTNKQLYLFMLCHDVCMLWAAYFLVCRATQVLRRRFVTK